MRAQDGGSFQSGDAKGLLIAAIEDPDPVIFLEPKRLYNGPFDGHHDRPVTPWSSHEFGEVPDGHYCRPAGDQRNPARRRGADDPRLRDHGARRHDCRRGDRRRCRNHRPPHPAAARPERDPGIGAQTGRCVIVHEATLTSGFGAELSALVQETCFYHLEAPVVRVAGWDTPYPHAQEWDYFPGPGRVGRALRETMAA